MYSLPCFRPASFLFYPRANGAARRFGAAGLAGWSLGLLGLLLAAGAAYAQPVLRSGDLPSAGDQFLFSEITGAGGVVDVDITGPDTTWDFTNLSPTAQDNRTALQPLTTSYGPFLALSGLNPLALYGNRQLAIELPELLNFLNIDLVEIVEFIENRNQDLRVRAQGLGIDLGFGAPIPVLAAYSDPAVVLNYPVRFGDSFADSFAYQFSIPDSILPVELEANVEGERAYTVDGWGQLNLPAFSYRCLRVRSELNFTINLTVEIIPGTPFNIPVPITQLFYQWYAPGESFPVASVSGLAVGGALVAPTVRYRDIDRRPVADFVVQSDTFGCVPHAVLFANRSIRAEEYLWEFGDGQTSTQENPGFHTYTRRDLNVFTVRLTARNFLGENTVTRSGIIRTPAFRADFQVSDSVFPQWPAQVQFINTSSLDTLTPQDSLSYYWNFGNGIFSTEQNPVHYYPSPGRYGARLITTYHPEGCRDTLERERFIRVGEPLARPQAMPRVELAVYPNPLRGRLLQLRLQLQAPSSTGQWRISNTLGQVVWRKAQEELAPGEHRLQFQPNLPPGLYHLSLQTDQGSIGKPFLVE